MTQLLPPKKDVALALLERSNVDVHLDPRAAGVVVPPQFRKEPQLILKVGLNMFVPIPDLNFDDTSMSCTLSFSRVPFFCVVPWSSVFAMVGEDGRGMVWPDDVPRELSVKVTGEDRPAGSGGAREASRTASASGASGASGAQRARGRAKLTDASATQAGAFGPRSLGAAEADGATPGPAKRSRKKKKDEGRPNLVAVPQPAPSGASLVDASRDTGAKDKRDASGKRRPVSASIEAPVSPPKVAAEPAQTTPTPAPKVTAPPSGRPKRELPPYLRVVK